MTDMHPGDIRHHIHNLLGTYAENADERDADAVAELFAHASVTFAGTTLLGRHDINAHYKALFAAALRSRHLLTNIIIDVTDTQQAAARCRYSRWSIDTDATLLAIGDCHATFLRHQSNWRFASFAVTRAWQTQP